MHESLCMTLAVPPPWQSEINGDIREAVHWEDTRHIVISREFWREGKWLLIPPLTNHLLSFNMRAQNQCSQVLTMTHFALVSYVFSLLLRAIHNWALFDGSGYWRRTASSRRPRKFGENAGQSTTWTFSSSRNNLQKRVTWGLAWSCWKYCCSGERKAGRTGAVSHRGIWQYSDYQQWHGIVCDVHGLFTPKPVRLRSCEPLCVRRWRQLSAPLCGTRHAAAHLLCEARNVTRHWRGHSSIVLVSSGFASWPRPFAAVVVKSIVLFIFFRFSNWRVKFINTFCVVCVINVCVFWVAYHCLVVLMSVKNPISAIGKVNWWQNPAKTQGLFNSAHFIPGMACCLSVLGTLLAPHFLNRKGSLVLKYLSWLGYHRR